MRILVDTSVWIRFLAGHDPYQSKLAALLGRGEVAGHPFVFGELLIGDRGERRQLLAGYELMHQAPLVAHDEVVRFVRLRRLHGRGIGWVDTHLVASALVAGIKLWTADPRLDAVGRELKIGHT